MCTQSQLNEILSRTVAEAKGIFAAAFHGAILYGSFARGDHDDESDIDILPVMEKDVETYEKYRDVLPLLLESWTPDQRPERLGIHGLSCAKPPVKSGLIAEII